MSVSRSVTAYFARKMSLHFNSSENISQRAHPFSAYTKFSEKLKFLTP